MHIFKVIKYQIPKESASYKCLSLIMLDSAITANKRYYLQTLLEESKYEITRNKVENHINGDIQHSSSSDEFDSKFGNLSDNGSDNDDTNNSFMES